jgi:hypothetical protein
VRSLLELCMYVLAACAVFFITVLMIYITWTTIGIAIRFIDKVMSEWAKQKNARILTVHIGTSRALDIKFVSIVLNRGLSNGLR